MAAIGFVIALALKEVPLRGTAQAAAGDLGDAAGQAEVDRVIAALRRWLAAQLADWGTDGDPPAAADGGQIGAALESISRRMLEHDDAPHPGTALAAETA